MSLFCPKHLKCGLCQNSKLCYAMKQETAVLQQQYE